MPRIPDVTISTPLPIQTGETAAKMKPKDYSGLAQLGQSIGATGLQVGSIALQGAKQRQAVDRKKQEAAKKLNDKVKKAQDEGTIADLNLGMMKQNTDLNTKFTTTDSMNTPDKWVEEATTAYKTHEERESFQKSRASLSEENRVVFDGNWRRSKEESLIKLKGQSQKRIVEQSNTRKMQLATNMAENDAPQLDVLGVINSTVNSDEFKQETWKVFQQDTIDKSHNRTKQELESDKLEDVNYTPAENVDRANFRLIDTNESISINNDADLLDLNGQPIEGFKINATGWQKDRFSAEQNYYKNVALHKQSVKTKAAQIVSSKAAGNITDEQTKEMLKAAPKDVQTEAHALLGDSLFSAIMETDTKKFIAKTTGPAMEFSAKANTRIASGKWDYPKFREAGIDKGVPLNVIDALFLEGTTLKEAEMIRTMGKIDEDAIADIYSAFGQQHGIHSFDKPGGGVIKFGQAGKIFDRDDSEDLIQQSGLWDSDGKLESGVTPKEAADTILEGYNNGNLYALNMGKYERDVWINKGVIDGKIQYEMQTVPFSTRNMLDIIGVDVPKLDNDGNPIEGEYTRGNARIIKPAKAKNVTEPTGLTGFQYDLEGPKAEDITSDTMLKYNISGDLALSTKVPVKYIESFNKLKREAIYPIIQKVQESGDRASVRVLKNTVLRSDQKLLDIMNQYKKVDEKLQAAWLDGKMEDYVNESREAFGLIKYGQDINLWKTK